MLYFTAVFLCRSAMWRGALSDFRSVCTASVHGWGYSEVVCECAFRMHRSEWNGNVVEDYELRTLSDFLNNIGGGVDNNMYSCERKL